MAKARRDPRAAESVQALGAALGECWQVAVGLSLPPQTLAELQSDYLERGHRAVEPALRAAARGRRRRRRAERRPALRRAASGRPTRPRAFIAQMYLLNARTLLQMAEASRPTRRPRRACASRCSSGSTRRRPSNFLALNPEAQKKALETQGESIAAGPAAPAAATCSRATCRRPTRARSRSAATSPPREGAVVFENELFQLHRVQAAHGQGARAAAAVRAAVHQQVLHPRPAARELADPLRGRAGPPRLRGQLAQRRTSRWPSSTWDDYIEHGAIKAIDVVQRDHRQRADQHARLLRRRHASSPPRWRCWRRAASSRRRA